MYTALRFVFLKVHFDSGLREVFIFFMRAFVPTRTYLGIIEAYIHPAPGGSGCFKARANGPVAVWSPAPALLLRGLRRHSAFNHRARLTCLYTSWWPALPCVVLVYIRGLFGWHRTVTPFAGLT